MSEFKFACPVCGQHITAHSSTSGGQIECPTCYRKIVVPQAPEAGDSKLILSAAQVAKARPTSNGASSQLGPLGSSARRTSLWALLGLLVLLGAAGATAYLFREHIFKALRTPAPPATNALAAQPDTPAPPANTTPVPTNISWTLELTNAVIPDTPVAGKIHGSGFAYNRAVLLKGLLLVGEGNPPSYDLGFCINLGARPSEELSGKTIEIAPDQPQAPHVGWRWKNEQQQPATQVISNGYLLRVTFGQVSNGHLPGKLYLCLPDADKSFAAGTFNAEIRKPPAPKPVTPKSPKPRH